eukprot:g5811.t1
MARCASLKPRAGDPLAIEMVELEQEELERQQRQQREMMEQMLLTSPIRSSGKKKANDPIDFFGAIRNLVETNISPEDIEKYTPVRDHPLHPGAFDAYIEAAACEREDGTSDSEEDVRVSASAQKIVREHQDSSDDLRAENRLLRERLSEVEISLQQCQDHSHRLLSEVETDLYKAKADLRTIQETAARDLSFQSSQFNAESAIARANSAAALAQLGEEFRLFREKAASSSSGADDALLKNAQDGLADERERFSEFRRAVEGDMRRLEKELGEKTQAAAVAAAAAASAEASLAKEREDFRVFRANVEAGGGAEAARLQALQETLANERGQFSAFREASEAKMRRLAADHARQAECLTRERGEFQEFGERAAVLEKEMEARLLKVGEDLKGEREQLSLLQRESEASRRQREADLARERAEFHAFREATGKSSDEQLRKAEEGLAEERRQFSEFRQASEASQRKAEEGLAAERRRFSAFKEASEASQRKVEEDLEAERRRFSEFRQASEDTQRQREIDTKAKLEAQAQAAAARAAAAEDALSKEREEFRAFREISAGVREALKRAEDTLAAERKQFSASKRTSAAKIELLRREANRVEDLEDQLASKGLRLKQKEAEARALATDGNVVKGLRESLTCKDNALNELRQELGNLRVASAAEAAPRPTMAAMKQQQQQQQQRQQLQQHDSTAEPYGENAFAGRSPPEQQPESSTTGTAGTRNGLSVLRVERPAVDMTRTLSMSSVDSFGEGSGLDAIAEEDEDEDEDTEMEGSAMEEEEEEEDEETENEELASESECESESDIETEQEEEEMEISVGEMALAFQGGVGEGDEQEEEEEEEEEEEVHSESDSGEMIEAGDEAMNALGEGEEEGGGEGEESETESEVDAITADDMSRSGLVVEFQDTQAEDGSVEQAQQPAMAARQAHDSNTLTPPKAVYGLKLDEGFFAENEEAAETFAAAKFAPAAPASSCATSAMLDKDEESDEDNDDEEEEEEENQLERRLSLVGSSSRGNGRASTGRRLSMSHSLSPGPRSSLAFRARASIAPGTRSMSPVPRGSTNSRASWSPGRGKMMTLPAAGPVPKCLSPMARLAPADHGMGREGNVVVLELGAWRVRAGVVSRRGGEDGGGGGENSYFDEFPCCVARPSKEGADLDELVNGASSLAAPMYSKFRETGVFVGGDAWYCCLDHPSIALRSQLRLTCPMQHGKTPTREDTDRLVDHAYGLLDQDSGSTPTLLAYKPTATMEEVLGLASVLLEAHRVPAIRMVNEAQLIALAVEVSNGVLVDIGESGLSVTPIFDGCPVAPAVRFEPCGGADVTKFLDYMLLSRTNEQFNQMTDRRRLEYTREIKEEQCYVPLDFSMEVDEYGAFKRKAMRVCKGALASPMLSEYEACDSRDFGDEADKDEPLTQTKTFTLKSGDALDVQIGRERFHAPEILFKPGLWKEGGVSRSLAEVVLDALNELDADSRAEMLEDIVVVGGSAHLDGLGDRLEEDLKALLPEWMGDRVDVRVPAADDLKHRNPLSRGIPSAVTVGAEILLDGDDLDGDDWITTTEWAETPDLLTRAVVPFLREDNHGRRGGCEDR